ncbi:glycoside hydrolase family 2 protein [Sphingobacterium suaedae]|uniref:beta-galactosidase n=1 Tax=Sphingobacterium suaedae TaxID=1686402 RepID=A0ABW5KF76_9SPHI
MRIQSSLILFFVLIVHIIAHAQQTEKIMLSGNSVDDAKLWDFYCTSGRKSGQWSTIRVPSCWEQEGFGEYNYGHDKNKASEKGRYRTSFNLPERWKDKRIFIVFEGSMTDTKVQVNGKQAGEVHQGAFYKFKREITDLVNHNSDNLLEVEVDKMSSNPSVNSAERDADFWVFGGIFRPVYLEAVPEAHIAYSGIDAKANGSITLEAILSGELDQAHLHVDIVEAVTGEKVGSFQSEPMSGTNRLTAHSALRHVRPWSSESPELYRAIITVMQNGKAVHRISERFGFRTVEVRARDGIYVNNRKMRFKGVNRHCFWPETGRTISKEQSMQDILLMKEMNMNAVRMSHYPPDKHFLELCDSLGLYVIDELCSWQRPPYDTQVGTKLVQEMVTRDVNHPSIVLWANGNEGGFNLDLDSLFGKLDIQKRNVIHPFGLFNGINTVHYINYNSGIKNMFNGRDIFMPTELIHGLYDGGHGAGLDDFWNLMRLNPLSAGMFLWDFSDQAVVRTDKGGILDTDKDHGADGILGPYREKEGSFFTIKEIWSPIFVERKFITPEWDGGLRVENRYDFTHMEECSFTYSFSKFSSLDGDRERVAGTIKSPRIPPGGSGILQVDLPVNWTAFDVLHVSAKDPNGNELFTWSFEVNSPEAFATRVLKKAEKANTKIDVSENDSTYTVQSNGVNVVVDKLTGLLNGVRTEQGNIPLSDGPILITDEKMVCQEVRLMRLDTAIRIHVRYDYEKGGRAYDFSWTVDQAGILQLDYDYRPRERMEMAGITFNFPEELVEGATLFANGPYRVYNNRMKGGALDIWEKKYNDAITGEVWDYPEFKGYYSLFYGVEMHTPAPFTIYAGSEDMTLHLLTPTKPKHYDSMRNYTFPQYPNGNLSFMDAIPAVGTKFHEAGEMGPQSSRHSFKSFSATPNMTNRLYFKFH